MMYVLFSPSEQKHAGGSGVFRDACQDLFGGWDARTALVEAYERHLAGSDQEKKALTGWSDSTKIDALPTQLATAPVLPAIERFAGMGYQYLDYASVSEDVQVRLRNQVWVFSNLFGPVRGSDLIPETKLKQTAKLEGIPIGSHYRQVLAGELDNVIGTSPVLDLRAKVYRSWYEPKGQVIVPEFLKAGKRVNHWSKAYRGVLLRYVAQQNCETFEELLALKMPELSLVEKTQKARELRVVYEAS